MKNLGIIVLLSSSFAFASSDSTDCVNATKTIKFGVGNSTNRIQINYVTKEGKKSTHDVPVMLKPFYDYNSEDTEQTLIVLPIGKSQYVKKDHRTLMIYDSQGKFKCSGREMWDDTYTQTMLITAKNYESVMHSMGYESKVPNIDETGYISAKFTCRAYGITTAGGCYAEEGDTIREVPSRY